MLMSSIDAGPLAGQRAEDIMSHTPQTTEARWYRIAAPNSDALYGYGTAAEADAYLSRLNHDREIDLYTATEITDTDLLAQLDAQPPVRNDQFDLSAEIA